MLEWGFSRPQLLKVIAHTPVGHPASQKVLIKNGFLESERSETVIDWEIYPSH